MLLLSNFKSHHTCLGHLSKCKWHRTIFQPHHTFISSTTNVYFHTYFRVKIQKRFLSFHMHKRKRKPNSCVILSPETWKYFLLMSHSVFLPVCYSQLPLQKPRSSLLSMSLPVFVGSGITIGYRTNLLAVIPMEGHTKILYIGLYKISSLNHLSYIRHLVKYYIILCTKIKSESGRIGTIELVTCMHQSEVQEVRKLSYVSDLPEFNI